jgi:hypothetical protein
LPIDPVTGKGMPADSCTPSLAEWQSDWQQDTGSTSDQPSASSSASSTSVSAPASTSVPSAATSPATSVTPSASSPTVTPTLSRGHVVRVNNNGAVVAWTGTGARLWKVTLYGPGPENGRSSIVGISQATYSGLAAGHTYDVLVQPLVNRKPAGRSGVVTFITTGVRLRIVLVSVSGLVSVSRRGGRCAPCPRLR